MVLVLAADLEDAAGALLAERIHLLGEAAEEAVLLLVLQHVLHHQGAGLRHGHPLDSHLTSQLRVDGALLLQIRSHYVQDSCLGETYGGCWYANTAAGYLGAAIFHSKCLLFPVVSQCLRFTFRR